jgi:hypothetical protein
MNCTRCDGTGFLNLHALDGDAPDLADVGHEAFLEWLDDHRAMNEDVTVCDCCGNGEDRWHGTPGQHYGDSDPKGPGGPYAYNGGLCECH